MKRKGLLSSILSLTMIFSLFAVPVHGAVIEEMQVDYSAGQVIVSGSLPIQKAGQRVGIEVFRPGILPSQVETADDTSLAEMISYFGQTVTAADGRYSFSFVPNGQSGSYYVRIGYGEANQSRWDSFYFINYQDLEQVLEQINSVTAAEELQAVVEEWGALLSLNTDPFDKLGDQKTVYRYILSERGEAFATIEDFRDIFWRCSVMQALNEESILQIIQTYPAFFENFISYITWTDMNEAGQKAAAEAMEAQRIYTALEDVETSFTEQTVLKALEAVDSYGRAETILENNAEYLGLDMDSFRALNNKNDILKALSGKRFDSTEEIRSLILELSDEENDNGGSHSGGGSGGGNRVNGGSAGTGLLVPRPSTVQETGADLSSEPEKPVFSDIHEAEWAGDAIVYLYQRQVIQGDGDGAFRPNDPVTRAEFVTMIVKCFDLFDDGAQMNFSDVLQTDWFYPYVASAVQAGIIQGVEPERFAPEEYLTREQMAVIVDRTAIYASIPISQAEETAAFSDAQEISPYARESVERMQAAGIVNGMGDNRFAPGEVSTRAQVCTILYKLISGGEDI